MDCSVHPGSRLGGQTSSPGLLANSHLQALVANGSPVGLKEKLPHGGPAQSSRLPFGQCSQPSPQALPVTLSLPVGAQGQVSTGKLPAGTQLKQD